MTHQGGTASGARLVPRNAEEVAMDTGRVGACHRTEIKRRKFLIVLNETVRVRYDCYDEFLARDRVDAAHRMEKSKRFVRRALVRQRVLQQCMKARREKLERADQRHLYGQYGGKSIDAFSREIDCFITENHPKLRRMKEIQRLMDKSHATGAILDTKTMSEKMTKYFERSLTKMRLKQLKKEKTQLSSSKQAFSGQQRHGLPKLPVLTNPFYAKVETEAPSGQPEVEILTLSADMEKLKVEPATDSARQGPSGKEDKMAHSMSSKTVLPAIPVSQEPQSHIDDPDVQSVSQRRTLVLPPIKTSKALVAN